MAPPPLAHCALTSPTMRLQPPPPPTPAVVRPCLLPIQPRSFLVCVRAACVASPPAPPPAPWPAARPPSAPVVRPGPSPRCCLLPQRRRLSCRARPHARPCPWCLCLRCLLPAPASPLSSPLPNARARLSGCSPSPAPPTPPRLAAPSAPPLMCSVWPSASRLRYSSSADVADVASGRRCCLGLGFPPFYYLSYFSFMLELHLFY